MNRPLSLVVCLAAALALGACQEQLRGGNACPSLCPEQQLGFQDTVFLASEVIDTAVTLPGLPSIGTETQLLVARYAQNGDSVVSVAVFRFDSLVRQVPYDTTGNGAFVSVDSSFLQLVGNAPPTGLDTLYVQDTVTLSAYDVFVDAPDLDTALVHARFTGTPIGTLTLSRDSVVSLIKLGAGFQIPIDTAFLSAQIVSGKRVWIGVSMSSSKNAQISFGSQEGNAASVGTAARLYYRGHADTVVSIQEAASAGPTAYGPAIPALADYQMTFQGAPAVPAGMLGVGGLPSNRTIIRFKFPAWLVDSTTTVVRANLELYQAPFYSFRADSDSLFMQPLVTVASPAVTDLSKVGILVLDPVAAAQSYFTGILELKLPPASTALDTIPLVRVSAGIPQNVISFWRIKGNALQRAIVLTLGPDGTFPKEGLEPRQLLFYGPSAAPALQPRVHVSYVPHSSIGLP